MKVSLLLLPAVAAASVEILIPPLGLVQPGSLMATAGEDATFAATITGTDATLQWQFNSTNIEGQTNAVLILADVTPEEAGAYTVVVSNALGAVTSPPAILTVSSIGLADALDSGPRLVWTTGGDSPWFGEVGTTHDGKDAAQSGQLRGSLDTASWIETTVTGPGILFFWWKFAGNRLPFLSAFELQMDAKPVAILGITSGWQPTEILLPSGKHQLRWVVTGNFLAGGDPPADRGWLDQVQFLAGQTVPVPLSLDSEVMQNTGGDAPWFKDTKIALPDLNIFQSGRIKGGQSSWIFLPVVGPGELSFVWKVSSRLNLARLEFTIGSQPEASISGNVQWQLKRFPIGAGEHFLTWTYLKDSDAAQGEDAGWLSQIKFTPARAPLFQGWP